MPRIKTFKRDDALNSATGEFWKKGFADTSIRDLEDATALRKSSLYAEFQSKENLYICCLEHYAKTTYGAGILDQKPLGWSNIERLIRVRAGNKDIPVLGCFLIFAMREYNSLPSKVQRHLDERLQIMREDFYKNISAETTHADPEKVTDMFMTFFTGLALNDNFRCIDVETVAPIDEIMSAMKLL